MQSPAPQATDAPDPAAVFASAMSLWHACQERAEGPERLDLSEAYSGMDQFMREVMRIADLFEHWACEHVAFDRLETVWPYLLESEFGEACLLKVFADSLAQFDDNDCLRVAMQLRLPIKLDDLLAVPIDLRSPNPVSNSPFRQFRIQTVRYSALDEEAMPYTADDDPTDAGDEGYGVPYFALHGLGEDGLVEHIADRLTYSEILSLVRNLAPGVVFPDSPVFGID